MKMIQNTNLLKGNKFIQPRTAIIFILLMFTLTIFNINFTSGAELDNVKSYDDINKEVTVENLWGLGKDISKIKLNTPLVYNVIDRGEGIEQLVAEYTIENFEDYTSVFNDMEFLDVKNGGKKLDRPFTYKYKVITGQKEILITQTICGEGVFINGGVGEVCYQEEIGTKFVDIFKWNNLDTEKELTAGNITIGIFIDIELGETIEWIPTLFGVRIDEWAIWNEGLNISLVDYWTLNETTGSTTNASVNGNNGTLINMENSDWTGGLIGNALEFSGSDEYVSIPDKPEWDFQSDFAISLWVNYTDTSTSNMIISHGNDANPSIAWYISIGSTHLNFGGRDGGEWVTGLSIANDSQWYQVVINRNGGNLTAWNGTDMAETTISTIPANSEVLKFGAANPTINNYIGLLDEIGIWNRSLTDSEISDLYNNGVGITYLEKITPIRTILNSPLDSTITNNLTQLFNASAVPINSNITNMTLFIWYSNGSLFNRTTNIVTGNSTNSTTYNISNFGVNIFSWNVYSCSENSSEDIFCLFASSNFSFEWRPFTVDSETFTDNVFETSNQIFKLNITTLPSITSVSSFLNYNGTRIVAETNCDLVTNKCSISKTLDIPLIISPVESENKSFLWEIIVFDGTNSFSLNTTSSQQNISRIHLETCNATYTIKALNFTAQNEINLTRVNPFKFDGTFDIWTGSGTIKRDSTVTNSSTNEVNICMLPINETFVDGQIEYNEVTNITFVTRNYYFQNNTIKTINKNITLFLLPSASSTTFILKVQDDNILPLKDHIILIQRYYPGEDKFRTVQISKTDDNGKTLGFFETETVDYRFIIMKDNKVLLTTSKQKIFGEDVPFTLTFTIGEDLGKPWEELEDLSDITFNLFFNKTNNLVTYTYTDNNPDFTLGRLVVEKLNLSFSSNAVICNLNSSLSSATLTCDVGTLTGNKTGTYIASGLTTRSGVETLIDVKSFIIETMTSIIGLLGVFMAFFIILISSFAFKFNEIAGIFMINASIIFVNIIGLVSFGSLAITAIIAVSIIIVAVIEK